MNARGVKIGLYYHPSGSVISFGPLHLYRSGMYFGRHHIVRFRQRYDKWRRHRWLPPVCYVTYNLVRWTRGRLELGLQWRLGNLWIGWHGMRTGVGQHVWICLIPCLVLHVLIKPYGWGAYTLDARGRRRASVQLGPQLHPIYPPRSAQRRRLTPETARGLAVFHRPTRFW